MEVTMTTNRKNELIAQLVSILSELTLTKVSMRSISNLLSVT